MLFSYYTCNLVAYTQISLGQQTANSGCVLQEGSLWPRSRGKHPNTEVAVATRMERRQPHQWWSQLSGHDGVGARE